jgi:hypothetical protein
LPSIADILLPAPNRRLGPAADRCTAATKPLFDHPVGTAEQREPEGDAERLGSLEVDDELDPGGLLDRQIARLFAFENPARGAKLR